MNLRIEIPSSLKESNVSPTIFSHSSCCIIIPIHPKHFDFIYEVIDSSSFPFDFILCFTNDSDFKEFKYNDKLKQYVILSDICDIKLFEHFSINRSWVNVKKLLCLQHIYKTHNYKYYIVCDAEIRFLKKSNTTDHIKELCDTKQFLGTETIGHLVVVQNINKTSISLLPEEWHDKLKDLTNNYKLLAWWSNIPIYETKYLDEFYNVLGKDYILKLTFYSFDHVIYYLFLVFKGYWSIISTETFGYSVILECYSDLKAFKAISNVFPLLWTNYKTYIQDPDYFNNHDKIFMIYHLDRK